MRLEAYWTWNAYIVGTGVTQADDHHLTVMEFQSIPGKIQLALKGIDLYECADPKRLAAHRGVLPIFEDTDIRVHMKLTP